MFGSLIVFIQFPHIRHQTVVHPNEYDYVAESETEGSQKGPKLVDALTHGKNDKNVLIHHCEHPVEDESGHQANFGASLEFRPVTETTKEKVE